MCTHVYENIVFFLQWLQIMFIFHHCLLTVCLPQNSVHWYQCCILVDFSVVLLRCVVVKYYRSNVHDRETNQTICLIDALYLQPHSSMLWPHDYSSMSSCPVHNTFMIRFFRSTSLSSVRSFCLFHVSWQVCIEQYYTNVQILTNNTFWSKQIHYST